MPLVTKPANPASGKYTAYVDGSVKGTTKRVRLGTLFPGNYPFVKGGVGDTILREARDYFRKLKPEEVDVGAADPALGKVDLTYRNQFGDTAPPGGELSDETLSKPGAPMNRFVPNLQSPGSSELELVVRVEGTDMTSNPKIKPEDMTSSVQVQDNPNLAQPADQNIRIKV